MKTAIISATIFVFVLILIIIFQNISGGNYVYVLFFYYTQTDGYVTPMIVMSGLGFLGGALSTMLIAGLITTSKDEEAPGGSNW